MPSKRHTYTFLSAIYLLALTILAVYSLHLIRTHNLPVPVTLGAFTLGLPAIVGLALEALTGTSNISHTAIRWSPRLSQSTIHTWSSYAITILFILETVLATLAAQHITPIAPLRCNLDTRWKSLFHAKDENAIRRIQDAFKCCGLHSPLDMAYPFPGGGRGADACRVAYGREKSCFDSWRGEERAVATVMLAVVAGTAAWKVLVIYMQTRRSWWAAEEGGSSAARNEDGSGQRRVLEYHDTTENGYRDQPDVVEEDVEDGQGVPALRVVPSLLRDEDDEYR